MKSHYSPHPHLHLLYTSHLSFTLLLRNLISIQLSIQHLSIHSLLHSSLLCHSPLQLLFSHSVSSHHIFTHSLHLSSSDGLSYLTQCLFTSLTLLQIQTHQVTHSRILLYLLSLSQKSQSFLTLLIFIWHHWHIAQYAHLQLFHLPLLFCLSTLTHSHQWLQINVQCILKSPLSIQCITFSLFILHPLQSLVESVILQHVLYLT